MFDNKNYREFSKLEKGILGLWFFGDAKKVPCNKKYKKPSGV